MKPADPRRGTGPVSRALWRIHPPLPGRVLRPGGWLPICPERFINAPEPVEGGGTKRVVG